MDSPDLPPTLTLEREADPIADGLERRLDPRIVTLRRIHLRIFGGIVASISFVGLVASWLAGGPTAAGLAWRLALWVGLVSLLAWWASRWPDVDYRHSFYRVDDLGIEVKRGVVWRIVINVPRSRIQHTDVSQGPLERRFGLGTLVVYTAGTDHARVSVSGLEHARALAIREHLLLQEPSDAV
jgi:uncharacterized protein